MHAEKMSDPDGKEYFHKLSLLREIARFNPDEQTAKGEPRERCCEEVYKEWLYSSDPGGKSGTTRGKQREDPEVF